MSVQLDPSARQAVWDGTLADSITTTHTFATVGSRALQRRQPPPSGSAVRRGIPAAAAAVAGLAAHPGFDAEA